MLEENRTIIDQIEILLNLNPHVSRAHIVGDPTVFQRIIQRERPHLAFLGLGRPSYSGSLVAQTAKMRQPDLALIFYSYRRQDAVTAFEIGAFGFLLCPIERCKLDMWIGYRAQELIPR